MKPRSRALVASSVLCLAAAASSSCGAKQKRQHQVDDDGGEAGAGQQEAGRGGSRAGSSSGSAGTSSGRGGSSGTGGAGGATGGSTAVGGSSAGSAAEAGTASTCAGVAAPAEPLPLDVYLMLDSSSSMLDESPSGDTKWNAVIDAIASFFDELPSNLGVGLQFFPERAPGVPDSCVSNSECGTAGPCFLTFCRNAGPDIVACGSSKDCVTAAGDDLGPCVPLTYCWSELSNGELNLCHDDAECSGGTGDCVPFAQCSLGNGYACPEPGVDCGGELGTCEAYDPPSTCVNESSCDAAVYTAPAVEVGALPEASLDLWSAITYRVPNGDTPTAPALAGAIAHVREWSRAHPEHHAVVVFATDGLPTACVDDPDSEIPGVDAVVSTAASGTAADPSISSYVIGLLDPDETDARASFDAIAEAGGTHSAFLIDTTGDVQQSFLAALHSIQRAALCELSIPTPADGNELDFRLLNVRLTGGGDSEILLNVADGSDCGSARGWHYDDGSAPTKIVACPATCQALQSGGSLEVGLGCPTVVQ